MFLKKFQQFCYVLYGWVYLYHSCFQRIKSAACYFVTQKNAFACHTFLSHEILFGSGTYTLRSHFNKQIFHEIKRKKGRNCKKKKLVTF